MISYLVFLMLRLLAVIAFGTVSIVAQTSLLPPNAAVAMTLLRPDSSYASRTVISVSGQDFNQAVRVQTLRTPGNNYDIQLNIRSAAPVSQGDVILATFWLRREAPAKSDALTEFVFEQACSPYLQSVTRTESEGDGQWTRFNVAFAAAATFPTGGSQMNFRLGFAPQIIDIGGFTATNYAKTLPLASLPNDITYSGRASSAAWRAPAAARIEQVRKANLQVQIRDADGHPIPGALVQAQMRRAAFGFGSAIDGTRLLGNAGTASDRAKYQGVITNWFNKAVLENDLKWPNFEANPSIALNALNWLSDRGIAVRGHNLIWPGTNQTYLMPSDVPKLFSNPAALRARIDQHFTNILTATKGKCVEWDVINEPYANHAVMDVLGYGEMVRWYQIAHALAPDATLFLNEYGNLETAGLSNPQTDDFYNKLIYLQTNAAPVGGAGFQSHFQSYLSPPDQVLAQLDHFAALGLAMEATEFDIDVPDENTQADYLRDFMTALFSHPSVNGIVMWGFWAGQHWRPNAALFRQNWEIKPNGIMWSNLVFHEWSTSTNLIADTNGLAAFRGFKGDYDITVSVPGIATNQTSVSLLSDGTVMPTMTLTLPALSVLPSANGFDLAWPQGSAGFQVESSSQLSPADWQPVTETPQLRNGRWLLPVNSTGTTRYFRLRR